MGNPAPHGADLRKGRFSEPNRIYHITTVSHHRQPLFTDFEIAQRVVCALRMSDAIQQTDTLAYVLMPDHLHWLFQLQTGDLSSVVQRVKSKSAFEVNRCCGGRGQVWQRGFHDHGLRRDEDVKQVARYIVANPLRAGLVESIGDYPFWDAIWL